MEALTRQSNKMPRSVVTSLIVVLAGVTLGSAAMFTAAKWPDMFVLVPIGGLLMAGGCAVAGVITLFDRGLKNVFRAIGGVELAAGLVALAVTANWIGAAWHRF